MITLAPKNQSIKVQDGCEGKFHVFYMSVLVLAKHHENYTSGIHLSVETVGLKNILDESVKGRISGNISRE